MAVRQLKQEDISKNSAAFWLTVGTQQTVGFFLASEPNHETPLIQYTQNTEVRARITFGKF